MASLLNRLTTTKCQALHHFHDTERAALLKDVHDNHILICPRLVSILRTPYTQLRKTINKHGTLRKAMDKKSIEHLEYDKLGAT